MPQDHTRVDLTRFITPKRFPVKLFEIRDSATFMPVMAVRLSVANGEVGQADLREFRLLRRAGYSAEQIEQDSHQEPYVILCKLDGVEAQYDPYAWSRSRTLPVAHGHIIAHWDELESGSVIDVQYLLGESTEPKKSEL